MFNTYGLFSVNRETFNLNSGDNLFYPKSLRDVIVTALRVHNGILNILGYIPGISIVSGCVRMGIGLVLIGVTMVIGNRKGTRGVIIGRWYDEAITTGIAQIARGALEALVPFGWVVNAALDVIATPINFSKEYAIKGSEDGYGSPYKDPEYPLLFSPLYLV